MSRRTRTGGALGHLLLVVALALGVFVMHAVGHPDSASASGTGAHASAAGTHTVARTSAAGTYTAPGTHTAAMGQTAGMGSSPGHAVPVRATGGGHGAHTSADSSSHHPGAGMDMASLCVAVLGGWVLMALLCAALARRPGQPVDPPAEAAVPPRPSPPPPRPLLAQLSVLRI